MNALPSPSVPPAGSAGRDVLRTLLERPLPAVMGVLNVTPDSFSDGGDFIAPDQALERARAMIADGVDIIDIGAESTRPYKGAKAVTAEDELARLRPVLSGVVALGVPVSIDSMKAEVVASRSIRARRAPTTSGACNAMPPWRRWWRREASPSSSCIIATTWIPPSTSSPT